MDRTTEKLIFTVTDKRRLAEIWALLTRDHFDSLSFNLQSITKRITFDTSELEAFTMAEYISHYEPKFFDEIYKEATEAQNTINKLMKILTDEKERRNK